MKNHQNEHGVTNYQNKHKSACSLNTSWKLRTSELNTWHFPKEAFVA